MFTCASEVPPEADAEEVEAEEAAVRTLWISSDREGRTADSAPSRSASKICASLLARRSIFELSSRRRILNANTVY